MIAFAIKFFLGEKAAQVVFALILIAAHSFAPHPATFDARFGEWNVVEPSALTVEYFGGECAHYPRADYCRFHR